MRLASWRTQFHCAATDGKSVLLGGGFVRRNLLGLRNPPGHAARQADQTPHEFAVTLGQLEPQLNAPVQALAAWYSQLAYAPRGGSGGGSAQSLQQLWRTLRATAAPPIAMTNSA